MARCRLVALTDAELDRRQAEELADFVDARCVVETMRRHAFPVVRKALSYRRHYSAKMDCTIAAEVAAFEPDIVFFEQAFMAQYYRCAAGLPRILSAVDAISLAAFNQARNGDEPIGKRLALGFLGVQRMMFERKYLRKFECVSSVAERDARYLRALIGKPVVVVPNGVDTEFFRTRRSEADGDAIVFTGVLNNPANVEACRYLIREVFPEVHVRYPWLKLVIAGRNPTPELVAAIPCYVELQSDLPDIRAAFKGALAFVAPFVVGAGIKNNVLQALAMGLPVLTTKLVADAIGLKDRETAYVETRGPEFVGSLLRLVDQGGAGREVGAAGRRHVMANYSWQAAAQKYLEMPGQRIGPGSTSVSDDGRRGGEAVIA